MRYQSYPCGVSAIELLFVYGTLRRGGSNDIARLAPSARFSGMARIRGALFDQGAYPAMTFDADGAWVIGELYEVTPPDWRVLDALEEVVTDANPLGQYFRVRAVATDENARPVECQVYVANPRAMRLERPIAGGDWLAFCADHRRTD